MKVFMSSISDIKGGKEFKYYKLIFIGALSIILACILSVLVIDVGKTTSDFGNPFYSNRIFIVTKDVPDNIRKQPATLPEKFNEKTSKGQQFTVISVGGDGDDWVQVNLDYKDQSGDKKTLDPGISYLKSAWIHHKTIGIIKTPFQLNLEMALDEKAFGLDKHDLGGMLNFFTERSNLTYIYYFITVLLWVFFIIVIRRLYELWTNYKNQDEMDLLIYSNSGRLSGLRKITQKATTLLPQSFLSTLHKSFMSEGSSSKFNEIYQDYLNEIENSDYSFQEKLRKSNVWIIRSGIFGTLLGLIIALFELYIAMYGVNPGSDTPLTKEFITQIQQALLGNALAVGTSITAHGVALVVEFFIGGLIHNESQSGWLIDSYREITAFNEYSKDPDDPIEVASQFKLSLGEMNELLDEINKELKTLPENVKASKNLFNAVNISLQDANETIKNLQTSVDLAKTKTNIFSSTFGMINESTANLKSSIDKANDEITTIKNESTFLIDKIRKSASSITQKTKNIFDSFNSLIGKISTSLNALKKSMDNDQDLSD